MTKSAAWMPFYAVDYLADTMHLNTLQHGAYVLLLMHYWRTGRPLPDEDARLAAIAKMSERDWRKIAPTIREFFRADEGRLHQKRADIEIAKQEQISIKRADAARQMHLQKPSKPDASAAANAEQMHLQMHPTVHSSQSKKAAKPLNGVVLNRARGNTPPERAPDPMKTGMADLKTVEGHPCVNGYFVDVLFDMCVKEAGMHLPVSLNAWQPLIGWLSEGYVDSSILWLIRKLAARDDYQPPRSLAYFTKAIHEDCRTGLRDGYAPWHE